MGLKVEIFSPPNASILSSMLYEGLLFVKSICGDYVDLECLKELWDRKKDVNFDFVGNDVKYALRRIGIKNDFNDFIKYMKTVTPQDLNIYVKINPELRKVLVGVKSFIEKWWKEESFSFQIMKVDRYKGITSTELNVINEQITVWADMNGVYLFFLGLLSAYVTAIRGMGINNYYFLFFDVSELPLILKNPKNWMIIKDNIANELQGILNEMKDAIDEIITLSVLLNSFAIKNMKEQNVNFANLRLVKISNEGNTYKVYNDMPLSIFADQKIYTNEKLFDGLQRALKILVYPAAKFINGTDKKGDGYHAYMALKYLYSYVVTSNSEHLEKFYREIHEADKMDSAKGYLLWVSKKLI